MNEELTLINQTLINCMKQDGLIPTCENGVIYTGLGPSMIKASLSDQLFQDGNWIIGLWIRFAINPNREDSIIYDCSTGIGKSKNEALETAIYNWYVLTAPAIFSLMIGKVFGEAEWIPEGDPYGIKGWDMFSSPHGFKGSDENKKVIEEFCFNNPPVVQLKTILANFIIDKPFNTIKLYYGFDGKHKHSEALINGKNNLHCAFDLISIDWPKINGYVSFSQFLLLLKKR